MRAINSKEKNKKKCNKIKAFFNKNSSKIKVPNFKNNIFKIEANIKKRLDYNIKYNLNKITGKEKDKNLTYCEDQTKYEEEQKKN